MANSYVVTRAVMLAVIYYESRYGAGYYRGQGDVTETEWEAMVDFPAPFMECALQELVDLGLVEDTAPPPSDPSHTTHRYRMTYVGATRFERYLSHEGANALPPVNHDQDGERVSPGVYEIADAINVDLLTQVVDLPT